MGRCCATIETTIVRVKKEIVAELRKRFPMLKDLSDAAVVAVALRSFIDEG